MKADILLRELHEVLNNTPWYGSPVNKLIEQVVIEKVYDKSRGPHSIADILIHMIAWTEETTERLKGKSASDPSRGDWPDGSVYAWQDLVGMFDSANELLKAAIVNMDEEMWSRDVNDDRYPEIAEKGSYEDLIKGIIQHHIYHSGQIAILNK